MELTDMKETYQVSKVVCRVTFALLCGVLFHTAYFIYNVTWLTIHIYPLALVALYWLIDQYEENFFTRPIEVRVPFRSPLVSATSLRCQTPWITLKHTYD